MDIFEKQVGPSRSDPWHTVSPVDLATARHEPMPTIRLAMPAFPPGYNAERDGWNFSFPPPPVTFVP